MPGVHASTQCVPFLPSATLPLGAHASAPVAMMPRCCVKKAASRAGEAANERSTEP
jgi:hypothetical protein